MLWRCDRFSYDSDRKILRKETRELRLDQSAQLVWDALFAVRPEFLPYSEIRRRVVQAGGRSLGDDAIRGVVRKLREKFEDDPFHPKWIETRRRDENPDQREGAFALIAAWTAVAPQGAATDQTGAALPADSSGDAVSKSKTATEPSHAEPEIVRRPGPWIALRRTAWLWVGLVCVAVVSVAVVSVAVVSGVVTALAFQHRSSAAEKRNVVLSCPDGSFVRIISKTRGQGSKAAAIADALTGSHCASEVDRPDAPQEPIPTSLIRWFDIHDERTARDISRYVKARLGFDLSPEDATVWARGKQIRLGLIEIWIADNVR